MATYDIFTRNRLLDMFRELDKLLSEYVTVTGGDSSSTSVTFTTAESRDAIASGETLAVTLGKISKWLGDLHKVAYSGKYSDLAGKLELDTTLSVEGSAADAKATGDKVSLLNTRISELITAIETNLDNANELELVDIRLGYDETVHASAGDAVRAIGEDLLALQNSLKDYIDKSAVDGLEYDTENYQLWLTSAGEKVGDPVTIVSGSGGSGGSTSKVTVINEGETAYNVAQDTDVILQFSFTSTDDGVQTGPGTCKITVNGATKATLTIQQGSNSVNVKDYVSDGENTVKITCSDIYGSSKSITYSVNVVVLSISSTFDASMPYSGDITFKFTPVGILSKTVHFKLDGTELSTMVIEASGKQNAYTIPAQPHGTHKFEVWATASLGEVTLTSNRLVYDIMCTVEGNDTVLIATSYEGGAITQGNLVEVPFYVYDPANLTASVTLTIASGGTAYSTQTLTVDRTQQTWSTRDYPTGEVTFTIACGDVSKTIAMSVTALSIDVEAETADLELHLASVGRNNSESNPAVWEDSGYSTTFQNVSWVDTGWVADDNGDIALRLSGAARAVIGFKPFSTDARSTGRTLELDYLVRDVNNREAVVIECMNGIIGFRATADRAYLKSEQSQVTCYYKDEERVRASFVIEPRSDYRLFSVYLNGVLSGAIQYPDNDNFQQSTPAPITLGSDYCTLDFYKIRSYGAALTADQIRDNYIADTLDVSEKLALYQANNIYDSYGRLTFDELVKRIPTMVIVGTLPTAKGNKRNVTIQYTDPVHPEYNYEDTATIDVQGTSSQFYVRKNWKIKTSSEHQVADGQLPAKVWCMKADYAEATGTHNTGNANYVDSFYDVKTPPQEKDSRVRTTIYGFPSVIFHKETESSTPEFIGKYNYNFDKGAENVFGFSSDEYPLAECWEFKNNTSDACLFHGKVSDSWGSDFEARYPDEYGDISAFKTMHSWVVSTWQDGATGSALGSTYTGVDGTTYTKDTAEYRLAKFEKEFETYFDKQFMTIYYLYTLVMLMVDQRAKNMFLTTWDGVKWQPWLYDNDTCLGINNEGALVFDYFHEDIDVLDGANVYNGQNSALWVNFRECFADDIQALYKSWRSDKKLTFQSVYDAFITNQSDKWSISVYNEDADYKYVSMLRSDGDASNLSQIRGTGAEHLGYFVDNRLNYLDSKFNAEQYHNDTAALRIYTPSTWSGVAPNADVTITPHSDMYAGIRYKANGIEQKVRAKAGVPITFTAPDETFNDTETAVFGASQISSFGDLSPLYCGSVDVANATKLTEIICGSGASGYSNTNLKELIVGTNRLLKKVDVRNCPALTSLALSGCPNIEEIYAEGSGVTGVELPKSGYLKVIHLPGTVTNLTILNQSHITDFTCAGYTNLTTLRVENCPGVPVQTILEGATNLSRVRLLDLNLELSDTTVLDILAKCSGKDENDNNTEKPVVTGTAHLPSITQSQLAYYTEKLPDLTLVYDSYISQYTVTFQNWDGTVLDVQYVTSGGDAVEPINAGRIQTPTREATAQYTYTFKAWSGVYTSVTSNRLITATFSQTVNQYTVRFYSGSAILQATTVDYGGSVTYDGNTPTYNGSEEGSFLFSGWSETTTNVVGDMNVYAQFDKLEIPAQVTAFGDCTWAQIKAVADAGHKNDDGDWEVDGVVWWSVGDEKTDTLTTGEEVTFQIYDFEHDDKPDGTKAPLTIGLKDLMNDEVICSSTSGGGYVQSPERDALNGTVYKTLPAMLQTIICEVTKTSTTKQCASTETSIEKLFLLSVIEACGTYYSAYPDTKLEGTKYAIFTDDSSRIKKYGGKAYCWFLRTRTPDTYTYGFSYCVINSDGTSACLKSSYYPSRYKRHFAFCV